MLSSCTRWEDSNRPFGSLEPPYPLNICESFLTFSIDTEMIPPVMEVGD
jgi:hypothetical protein